MRQVILQKIRCSLFLLLCGLVSIVAPIPVSVAAPPFTPPSSEESIAAFKRAFPRVTKRLNELGLAFGSPVYFRIFKQSKELELWLESPADRVVHISMP